ncbi:DUF998 domain-containing protein [Leptolyngbyaceae cyanobacterium CCMR0082]|uniref:DUF998 domain-containing protein n=2 Tax=Adonisia TaxID=2950183 RepID=A0A6M0SGL2_9CYAN|nr:DUF998 domain-containing protein [Adonisia turfae CCMR0082]
MNKAPKTNDRFLISYLELRKAIGILGISLPFILAIGGIFLFKLLGIQPSLSGYYYTGMRDVFVGNLCAIGVFLWSYKGYERSDDIAGDLACIFAVGVAFFPTFPPDPSALEKVVGIIHFISAACFFIVLAYFCFALFTKSDSDSPTDKKLLRNAIYKACGFIIVGALVLLGLNAILPESLKDLYEYLDPVFWLESIAIIAFGFSWFVKGEGILKDEIQ